VGGNAMRKGMGQRGRARAIQVMAGGRSGAMSATISHRAGDDSTQARDDKTGWGHPTDLATVDASLTRFAAEEATGVHRERRGPVLTLLRTGHGAAD
jgi:hypothetical protein